MDANIINSFIQDLDEIIGQIAPGIHLERSQPHIRKETKVSNSAVAIIGINGQVEGQVFYTFTIDFALQLVSVMCGGMTFAEIDDMASSALGEVANMLSARAAIRINEITGKAIDITPPAVLHSTAEVSINVQPPIVCVPYLFNSQPVFEINFAIR